MDTMTNHPDGPVDDLRWRAVVDRDTAADGAFVYAVRTTGIYCRPSCASRKPRRDAVAFYAVPEAAEQAGFRPCRRCQPRIAAASDPRVAAVREACRMIEARAGETAPTLEELAKRAGFSPYHFQRLFSRLVGISPRQYGDALRLGRFREAVRSGDGVTGAMYEAGYGSSSRLYEKAQNRLGMTPATYGRGGQGARIAWTTAGCVLGRVLVAETDAGVCFVAFGDDDTALAAELADEFPRAAEIRRDDAALGASLAAVLDRLDGHAPHPALPLDIRATAFQRRVWHALAAIPEGETRTYSEIARSLDVPGAQRAVGRACATNPVSVLIPCHRAVREDGGLGGYRWGLARKKMLIARESAETALRR